MAYISASKPPHLNPILFSNLSRLSTTHFKSLRSFSSESLQETPDQQPPNPQPDPQNEELLKSAVADAESNPSPVLPQGKNRKTENLEDTVCRMMANRAWTTRLQNSIRGLVPEFDHDLVYNILHSSRIPDQALQFFRWVERTGLFKHDRETHFKIIEILGRASKLNHARCILLEMPKKGLEWDEDLFIILIDSYAKAGIVQESVKLFDKMKKLGVPRTIKSYNALFKVIMRRGRYMMAKRYFNRMLSEGIVPTCHTYNLMLFGFFLSSRVETANRFFEDMKKKDILPDVVTYNTMINGFIRNNKVEDAEKLFVEMKGKNLEPTVITYTTMIKGYVSDGRVDEGLRLIEEMKGFGIKPNDFTYATILPRLCDAEKMFEAQTIVKEMVNRHVAPKDNLVFIRLIEGQCKLGNMDAASEGAVEMEPTAFNSVIEYLCNNGMTEKAETFFRQLMKIGVQDEVAFNNLISGRSKEGSPDSAFELLKIMIRRKIPTERSAFKLLIESYLKKGDPADAKTVFDCMIENGHLPDSSLYRSVMESLFKNGRVQTASRVMKTMVEKGAKEHMDLVAKILEALLMRGHVEEALGRIDLLMHAGCAPDFDSLLSVLCVKGETIAAIKLLDFCLERDYNVDFSSYDKVLDSLLAGGKTLNAYSILCKIKEKGGVTEQSSCKELIKSLNEEGNTKQADILSRMFLGKEKKKGMKQASMGA